MTSSNQQRADRAEQAISAYSDNDDYTNLVDFCRRHALVRLHGHRISTFTWLRLAATTSTNSTTNNKTKGE